MQIKKATTEVDYRGLFLPMHRCFVRGEEEDEEEDEEIENGETRTGIQTGK